MKRSRGRNQALARLCLTRLSKLANVEGLTFSEEHYEKTSSRYSDLLDVDESSLTPSSARFLLGVGALVREKKLRVVVIGAYQGLYAAWIRAGACEDVEMVLVDPDIAALERARLNLDLCTESLDSIVCVSQTWEEWDGLRAWCARPSLVFVDLDSPDSGKAGYLDVWREISTFDGEILGMFHDTCLSKFKSVGEELQRYSLETGVLQCVLPVDQYGFSVFRFGESP